MRTHQPVRKGGINYQNRNLRHTTNLTRVEETGNGGFININNLFDVM